MMTQRMVAGCVITMAAVTLGGCAIINVDHDCNDRGSVPGRSTLGQITPGETTIEWVLTVAGPPSSRKQVDDGTEVLCWRRRDESKTDFNILFLITSKTESCREKTVYIEARDGIVQRYWVETDDS